MIPRRIHTFFRGANTGNALTSAINSYITTLIKNPPDHVDSPEAMEDMIKEWLGENGHKYPRCRVSAVVTLVHPFREGHWPSGTASVPCLRVFYESMNGYDLNVIAYIGFVDPEKIISPALL